MIVKNSKIPKLASLFINVYAITIYPFIFIRDEGNITTINHERIHLAQQKELLVIPFYILYVFFWMFGLFKYKNAQLAYMSIPFEKEAYSNHDDIVYLLNRKRNDWLRYI
jgi:hypothetical protein